MGAVCNRMLPRAIPVTHVVTTPTPVTLIGVGREGVMNGGSSFVVTVDGTGTAIPSVTTTTTTAMTIVIYYRATPTSPLVADATTVTMLQSGNVQIEISPPQTGNYEIVMTGSLAGAGAPENAVVSCQTVRV